MSYMINVGDNFRHSISGSTITVIGVTNNIIHFRTQRKDGYSLRSSILKLIMERDIETGKITIMGKMEPSKFIKRLKLPL